MIVVITPKDAIAIGQKWYFTGNPCPNGHVAKRSVTNRECRSCVEDRKKKCRLADPKKSRESDRKRYHKNVETKRCQMRESRKKYVDDRRAYDL